MANEYYTVTYNFEPDTLVASAQIDAEFAAIVSGLDLMPTVAQFQSANMNFIAAGGTANAITFAAPQTTWASYTGKDGFLFCVQITTENTGAVTLNVDGLGVKTCVRNNGDAMVAGDLQATGFYWFIYDETAGHFKVTNADLAAASSASAAAAATSAANAATSETNAATSETNAAASYDSFDDRYLGSKSSAPTLDNDSNALITGALYWNSVTNLMYCWDSSAWQVVTAVTASATTTTEGLVELATTAEVNTGTDTSRAVTPAGVEAWTGSAQVTTLGTITSLVATTMQSTGKATFDAEIVEAVFAVTGTTPALDAANGTIQTWTLSGNSTPTSNLTAGESITIHILDGTAYTITWPTMEWTGGAAPTLDTTNETIVELWYVGSTLYGALVGVSS